MQSMESVKKRMPLLFKRYETEAQSHLRCTVRTWTLFKQVERNGNVVVVSGDVQCGQAVLALDVGVDASCKQQAHDLQVAVFRCYV